MKLGIVTDSTCDIPKYLVDQHYPDSGKIQVDASGRDGSRLRKMFRAETSVDYYDRESNESPQRGD